MYSYKTSYWTSDLQISSDAFISEKVKKGIADVIEYIDTRFSAFKKEHLEDERKWLNDFALQFGLKQGDRLNLTCLLKGLAIDKISEVLEDNGANHYLVNFGGDIYVHDLETPVNIAGSKFFIGGLARHYSVFTSGNVHRRGNHIVGGDEHKINVAIVEWKPHTTTQFNYLLDALTTKRFAHETENVKKLEDFFYKIDAKIHYIDLNEEGKLLNQVYGASPFFNEKQIATRDKMISNFTNVYRPDLTKEAEEYNATIGDCADETVAKVVEANVRGITESEFLVFPNDTVDLGTLWEVGFAAGKDRPIISYRELDDSYTIIYNKMYLGPTAKDLAFYERTTEVITTNGDAFAMSHSKYAGKNLRFNCNDKQQCVLMGYACAYAPADKIWYELKGSADNIMLSVNYNHFEEESDGKFYKYKRSNSERDFD